MAIDTKAKLFSVLNMSMPVVYRPLIDPDGSGTITEGDRYHLLHLYSGISLDPPPGSANLFMKLAGHSGLAGTGGLAGKHGGLAG